MLATIRCIIFRLPTCFPKTYRLKCTQLQFRFLFYMGVKLGPSQWGRNIGWGCSKIGYSGRKLIRTRRNKVTGDWISLMQINPRPLPSKSCPIRHPAIVHSYDKNSVLPINKSAPITTLSLLTHKHNPPKRCTFPVALHTTIILHSFLHVFHKSRLLYTS